MSFSYQISKSSITPYSKHTHPLSSHNAEKYCTNLNNIHNRHHNHHRSIRRRYMVVDRPLKRCTPPQEKLGQFQSPSSRFMYQRFGIRNSHESSLLAALWGRIRRRRSTEWRRRSRVGSRDGRTGGRLWEIILINAESWLVDRAAVRRGGFHLRNGDRGWRILLFCSIYLVSLLI